MTNYKDTTFSSVGSTQKKQTLKIESFLIPRTKYTILYLLTDEASNELVSAFISETLRLIPLTLQSVNKLAQMSYLGGLRLDKRFVHIKIAQSSMNIGLVILARIIVPVETVGKLKRHQIAKSLEILELKRKKFMNSLLKSECIITRLSCRKQLVTTDWDINVDDVIFFKEPNDLIPVLFCYKNYSSNHKSRIYSEDRDDNDV
ncbi:MAG: hypothetical protein ACFFCQ_13170 [Promethearchaeota archaeon]